MDTFSENQLIAKFFAPLSGKGAFALKDDAALLQVKAGEELVVSTDTLVSGVHFFESTKPEHIAAKALRSNLSDLAAKGATPLGYLLALAMPEASAQWLRAFTKQLKKDQDHYGIVLLGGDTTKSKLLTLTITVFGTVPKGKMVGRSGAKRGDILAVTGTIGDAALGLKILKGEIKAKNAASLITRYNYPEPRNVLAKLLRDHASAAMDISDGFVGDLQKLCDVSKVSAEVELEKIPYSQAASALIKKDESFCEAALAGGDDYEVLFTIAPEKWARFARSAHQLSVPVAQVGRIINGKGVPRFTYKKEPHFFKRSSYQHF